MSRVEEIVARVEALSAEAGGGDGSAAMAFLLGIEEGEVPGLLYIAIDVANDRIRREERRDGHRMDRKARELRFMTNGIELGVAAERERARAGGAS